MKQLVSHYKQSFKNDVKATLLIGACLSCAPYFPQAINLAEDFGKSAVKPVITSVVPTSWKSDLISYLPFEMRGKAHVMTSKFQSYSTKVALKANTLHLAGRGDLASAYRGYINSSHGRSYMNTLRNITGTPDMALIISKAKNGNLF